MCQVVVDIKATSNG